MSQEMKTMITMILIIAVTILFIVLAASSQHHLTKDIYLKPGQKVVNIQIGSDERLFITTRSFHVDEHPDVFRICKYHEHIYWTIHETE